MSARCKIVDKLGLNESNWHGISAAAFWMSASPEFCNVFELISGVHEQRPAIGTQGLVEIEKALIRQRLEEER